MFALKCVTVIFALVGVYAFVRAVRPQSPDFGEQAADSWADRLAFVAIVLVLTIVVILALNWRSLQHAFPALRTTDYYQDSYRSGRAISEFRPVT